MPRASVASLPEEHQLRCDNFGVCGEVVIRMESMTETYARARAKGWHIYDGFTLGGKQVHWVLGPACVGAHRRAWDPLPKQIPDQMELF